MTLSTASRETIAAFAAQLGLPLPVSPDGSYSFAFRQSGLVTFTAAEGSERVVMSLARRVQLGDAGEERLLQLAGPDPATGQLLHTGVTRDGSAVFAVSLDEGFDLPAVEAGLQRLLTAGRALG